MMHRPFYIGFILLLALLLVPQQSFCEERISKQPVVKMKTIYIDPWYGGWEIGPFFAEKQFGKDVTYKIAKRVQDLLEADGFIIILSRTGDRFISLEQRSFEARATTADFFLSIKVSIIQGDCIHILTNPPPRKESRSKSAGNKTSDLKEMRAEVGTLLNELAADERYTESRDLAEVIAKKLREDRVSNCVVRAESSEYLLKNATMPAVIIDLGTSSSAYHQTYLLAGNTLNTISRLLAEAIKAYAKGHVQQSTIYSK